MIRLAIVCAVVLLAGTPARADIIFLQGNNPQPDEQTILLNDGTTGAIVFGETNQTGTSVEFSSAESITQPLSGQARIESTDGSVNHVSVSLAGDTFQGFIFDAFLLTGSSELTAVVVDNFGAIWVSTVFALSNGSNFLTITAINGQQIGGISLNSPTGFTDLRQMRIAGVPAPEPATAALMMLGITGFAVMRRRRVRAK